MNNENRPHGGSRIMDVIAGQYHYGLSGMGGPAEDASIDEPWELASDGKGINRGVVSHPLTFFS